MKITAIRTKRQDPGRSRLMPREYEALAFIAEAQPVATPAYQEFLGVSPTIAQRSLRKLRNHGLINVHVAALEVPSHFTLTKKAVALLSEATERPVEAFRVSRGLGKVHVAHHDGAVRLYAVLHRACRENKDLSLASFTFEDQIRRELGVAKQTQVPDAAVTLLSRSGSQIAWAVEIDQATETVPYVVEKKAKPYAELQAQGAPLAGVATWRVVCIVPSEQRLKRLVAALYEAGIPEGQWYFAVRSALLAETVLSTAWQTVRTTPGGAEAKLVIEPPLPGQPVRTDYPNGSDRRIA